MSSSNLSIGIVGLPNVGKSTLFNALLKKSPFAKASEGQAGRAKVANYPFCTIEPNVGVVEVPDSRLAILAKVVNTQKIVPAVVEFYDIAGLVKGASTGEGLGNKFLSHIREVAAIAHVVRLFEDGDIIHVQDTVDALRDIQTIETELIFADLATLFKQKEPKGKFSKEEGIRYDAIVKLKGHLNAGSSARTLRLTDDETIQAKDLHLLTMKPEIFVFNVSEEQLMEKEKIEEQIASLMRSTTPSGYRTVPDTPPYQGGELIPDNSPPYQGGELIPDNSPPYQGGVPEGGGGFITLNAKLENDVLAFEETDQKEYLHQYHLEETGLNRLIKTAYETLGLMSFLTGGELEARAWTIPINTLAPQAAGTIHTDFEKKFIKADIVQFENFVKLGGWVKAREQGKVQIVGRDYVMKEGDVVEFKIGA